MLVNDSNRSVDEFGYMTVENCTLTGDDVAAYFGYEIPGFKNLGLEEKKIYWVYRPISEIKDANFSNKPLLSQHIDFRADDFKHKFISGTIGETKPDGEKLKGTVVFWKKQSIDELEKGKRYLSCGYLYTPILENGFHKNQKYDIKMVDIVANHVAIVDNPRYKSAIVADEALKTVGKKTMFWNRSKKLTLDAAIDEIAKILATDEDIEEKEKAIEKIKSRIGKDKKTAKDEPMEPIELSDMPQDEELEDKDEEEEEKLESSVKEKNKKTTKDKKMAQDFDSIQKLVSDSVSKEIEKLNKNKLVMDSSIKEYERVCGRVNRLAFDSADKVLDAILKNHKYNYDNKTTEQKLAMVEMIPSIKIAQSVQQTLAMDSSFSDSSNHTPIHILEFLKRKAG